VKDPIKDTARYQLDIFITDNQHILLNLELDSADFSILYALTWYMDRKETEVCFAFQTTLITRCGMSESSFRRHIKKLVEKGLIEIKKVKYSHHYRIGFMIKEYVQIKKNL
jgi:DNA-binding MarR family transcriptional regulator